MGLRRLIQDASNARILVVGDMALDCYRVMRAKRLSSEAPVVIFSQERAETRPGCAANVANNLHALGCKVKLISCVGTDWHSYEDEVDFQFPVDLVVCNRKTTVKERIITSKQQIARIDLQSDECISYSESRKVFEKALSLIDDFDVLLFSDYDHGSLTPSITNFLSREFLSKGKRIVVDSKALDSFVKYEGASIMLPNDAESRVMTGMKDAPIRDVADNLRIRMRLGAIGVTLGAKGILLLDGEKEEIFPPYGDDEVVDITGAGDTAAAAVALGLALGAPTEDAIRLANIMGGLVVMKRGVATVGPREVEDAIEEISNV